MASEYGVNTPEQRALTSWIKKLENMRTVLTSDDDIGKSPKLTRKRETWSNETSSR